MFELRANPQNSRVYMCPMRKVDRDRNGYKTHIDSYNGTGLQASYDLVNSWPVVGHTACLFDWQAGKFEYAGQGHTLDVDGEFPNQQMIVRPLEFGTKVQTDSRRHDLTTAYLFASDKVLGGGYRYRAVFVSPTGRHMRANLYSNEISCVLTKGEETTLELLRATY